MNPKFLHRRSLAFAASALALLAFCPGARAAWSSIHANNHSPAIQHPTENRTIQGTQTREHVAPAPEVRGRVTLENRGHEHDVRAQFHNREFEHARIEHQFRDRHLGIDEDRHRGYYWYNYHPGMIVGTLPFGYSSVFVGST